MIEVAFKPLSKHAQQKYFQPNTQKFPPPIIIPICFNADRTLDKGKSCADLRALVEKVYKEYPGTTVYFLLADELDDYNREEKNAVQDGEHWISTHKPMLDTMKLEKGKPYSGFDYAILRWNQCKKGAKEKMYIQRFRDLIPALRLDSTLRRLSAKSIRAKQTTEDLNYYIEDYAVTFFVVHLVKEATQKIPIVLQQNANSKKNQLIRKLNDTNLCDPEEEVVLRTYYFPDKPEDKKTTKKHIDTCRPMGRSAQSTRLQSIQQIPQGHSAMFRVGTQQMTTATSQSASEAMQVRQKIADAQTQILGAQETLQQLQQFLQKMSTADQVICATVATLEGTVVTLGGTSEMLCVALTQALSESQPVKCT